MIRNLDEKERAKADPRDAYTPPAVLDEYRRLTAYRRETLEFHLPYSEETRSLLYVRNGDPEGILRYYADLKRVSGQGGVVGHNAMEQARSIFVVSVTLFTRFAVEGGLPQEEAYNLSDAYIRTMHTMNDAAALLSMVPTIGADMAARVRENRRTRSALVKTCLAYITNHKHYKITVAQLARECGLTPNYLSARFKEQMGVGLQEYIISEKLEAARWMLLVSGCSVAEAAEQFAFPSHSAFSAQFKRKYGDTPARYMDAGRATAWSGLEE